jgi:hypothetical protein
LSQPPENSVAANHPTEYRRSIQSRAARRNIRLFVERMRSDAQTAAAAELPADVLTPLRDLSRHLRCRD